MSASPQSSKERLGPPWLASHQPSWIKKESYGTGQNRRVLPPPRRTFYTSVVTLGAGLTLTSWYTSLPLLMMGKEHTYQQLKMGSATRDLSSNPSSATSSCVISGKALGVAEPLLQPMSMRGVECHCALWRTCAVTKWASVVTMTLTTSNEQVLIWKKMTSFYLFISQRGRKKNKRKRKTRWHSL